MTRTSDSKLRGIQVFGISLTEMMLILLFFMFLVAKNAIDSGADAVRFSETCNAQLSQCEIALKKAELDISVLTSAEKRLKNWVALLLKALGLEPLPPTDDQFEPDARQKIAKLESDARQRMGKGKGGVGKPNCLAGSSHVLELLMEDGYVTARKAWSEPDNALVDEVSAVQGVIDAGRIPFGAFEKYALTISRSKLDCTFSVIVSDRTTIKATYKPQLLAIERHFRRRVQ